MGGSFVNVRAGAEKNAAVRARLVINTPVKQLGEHDGACEIAWGEGQQAYIACAMLSDKAATLVGLGAPTLADGLDNPAYPVPRAFWLEPAYSRLLAAAAYFERTQLPAKQRELEERFIGAAPPGSSHWKNAPPLRRAAIPEFDAMKALLAKGVVAPASLYAPAPTWAEVLARVKRAAATPDAPADPELPQISYRDPELFGKFVPPPARASFFKNVSEIGGILPLPEKFSAQYGIPWKLTVNHALAWGGDDISGPARNGASDMGMVTQALATPVYGLVLSEQQTLLMATTLAERREVPGGRNGECLSTEQPAWPGKAALAAAAPFDNPLTVLHFPRTIKLGRAKLTRTEQERASTIVLDLDGDGAADVLIWRADYENGFAPLILVNVGGLWHLLDFSDPTPCGD
ncbi:MAG TPA: hypothetical protein DCW29_12755 [Janthinobacterium sp.]|nr:hypothetical protein [Janthinobacterium sp.]